MGTLPILLQANEGDFRLYVWAAYGAVLVLLFIFTWVTAAQLKACERKVDELRSRVEQK